MLNLFLYEYSQENWATVEDDWSALYSQCQSKSAFLSPDWMRAWWEAFGSQLKPQILVWRDNFGAPAGAAIVSLVVERIGPLNVRAAYLNATGERRVASEHNRILCLERARDVVLNGLVAHTRTKSVDMLRLCGFDEEDAGAIAARWQGGLEFGFASEDRYVPMNALRLSGQSYIGALSKNTREQIRRSVRAYERKYGPLTGERILSKSLGESIFTELLSLHEQRWRARGERGAFADQNVLQFHQLLQSRCSDEGREGLHVEFFRVKAGSVTVGILLNLVCQGVVNFYQSGFLYDSDSKFKPGLVTHLFAVQQYLDAGYYEYDFLAGEVNAVQYKKSMGLSSRRLIWNDLGSRNIKMRLLTALRAISRHFRRRGWKLGN